MFEPSDLNADSSWNSQSLEGRLRSARPTPPGIDRDRLMYLAGQRSMPAAGRSNRFWQTSAVASWAMCASLIVLLISREPVVVTETKIVERTVEVPQQTALGENDDRGTRVAVPTGDAPPRGPAFDLQQDLLARLLDDDRTLTLGDSRPEFRQDDRRTVALAATPRRDASDTAGRPPRPATQTELRRELLNELGTGTPARGLLLPTFR